MKLKQLRITTQILFFALFLFFFFFAAQSYNGTQTGPLGWLLRINPLSMLLTSVASRSIVLSFMVVGIVMLIATMLFGRFFCGMLCPLGTIIDLSDRLWRGKREKRNNPLRPPKQLQKLKYAFLIILLIAAASGVLIPLFFDPLLLATRFFALLVKPAFELVGASFSTKTISTFAPSFKLMGGYVGAGFTAILFFLIFFTSVFDRRFWCQYICPTGAFLGFLSKTTLLKRTTEQQSCNKCGLCCDPRCPTRAISGDNFTQTSAAECILCGECTADKRSCSSFHLRTDTAHGMTTGPDFHRRNALATACAALFFIPVYARKSPKKNPFVPGLIRPPGAVQEPAFLSRCITCGACIGVCPRKALHPATLGDGFVNLNTPKLVPRIGYCDQTCVKCATACPTGALLPITLEQKQTLRMGTAVVERSKCRPWLEESPCKLCAQKCPYNAITMVEVQINGNPWEIPQVDQKLCNGCGICEFYCPVRYDTAIRVYAFNERRLNHRRTKPEK
ncbi:MAG: 4Fe-4S binding protein [Chitinivibrionales bacterium]|nr:4Fe-4S binding protein [Chitinivibrionales bacterium]